MRHFESDILIETIWVHFEWDILNEIFLVRHFEKESRRENLDGHPVLLSALGDVLMKNEVLTNIAFAKELHPHDSEDEDNDAQHESEVTQGPHCLAHNGNE